MAAPTSLGISPCLGVRLPKAVFQAIHMAVRLRGTTAAALARECICHRFDQILRDADISLELNQHIVNVNSSKESQP